MNTDIYQLKEWQNDARRELNNEIDELNEKKERIDNYMRALDVTDKLCDEIDNLKAELDDKQTEIDTLRQQLQDEKEQRTKAEMQLKEMSQLSAGVAKKASQDELLKAIRVFVNKSKRKKIEKRIAVKEMVLEMANANGVVLPEDLAATIDALDDEQPEPKVVNTYNAPVGQVVENANKIVCNI